MEARKILRQEIEAADGVVQVVGAHNAIGARLVERNNFDAVWAGGFEISAAQGKPDANILTMTEFLDAARQMVESTALPVIADCDTGFGHTNNVIRMVTDYERAGVAAVCIEDKVFPKTNSFIEGRQTLESVENFCEKIVAAQYAKEDPDFLVIARIESLIAGEGMKRALERAHYYEEAGADMILIHSKKETADEVFQFSSKWKKHLPVAVVPTTYPDVTLQQLKDNNITMVIYANQILRAAVKAMDNALSSLAASGSLTNLSQLASMDDIFELQGMNKMLATEEWIKRTSASSVVRKS